nr:hypothetical protein TDPV-352 [Oriental turtle dovepox virus]
MIQIPTFYAQYPSPEDFIIVKYSLGLGIDVNARNMIVTVCILSLYLPHMITTTILNTSLSYHIMIAYFFII